MKFPRVIDCVAALALIGMLVLVSGAVDHYKVLGLARNATDREIKSAYRKLALELHPDKLGENATEEDHERFLRVIQAYETLSDPNLRAYYDEHGEDDKSRRAGSKGMTEYQSSNFDMFVRFPMGAFEFHFKQTAKPQPPPIMLNVQLTLEEVYTGTRRELNVTRQRFCPVCGGRGALPEHLGRCDTCNGRGRYLHLKMCDHGKGYSHGVNVDCHHCEGTGQVIVTPCSHCNGTRYITDTITVPVTAPPGVKHGAQEAFKGEGNQVFKQANGDIIITVEHKPHALYTVASNGIDLVHITTVSLVDAILGYSKNLTLLDGSILQVEHSTIAFSGASINYLFKGLPDAQNPDVFGSLSVQFKVQFPRALTKRQRDLLQMLITGDELALLESLLRMAAAAAAADSSKVFTPEDYVMSAQCAARDPFICVPNSQLLWLHLSAPVPEDSEPSTFTPASE